MKKIIILLLLSGFVMHVRAQNGKGTTASDSIITSTYEKPLKDMPYFTGGDGAFYTFLKNNIKYPDQALKEKKRGRVIVTFVVEKDGSLSNFKVGFNPGLGMAEEAVRVLKLSPKWTPGYLNGKPVRVQYAVPVSFEPPK